jgi:hypothetical protein
MRRRRYLPEILTIVAELVLVSILHLQLSRIGIGEELELLYLLIIGIFPILFYTFYKSFVVHEEVNSQSRELERIRSTLDESVKSIQGEAKILTFLDELRKNSRGIFYGMWALDYRESLDVYFQNETNKFEGKRVRLFNINTLSQKSKNLKALKKHLINNESEIKKGDYEVYPTNFSSFELVICEKVQNAQDIEFPLFDNLENSRDVAIQLFNDPATDRVKLAVYSNETGWVAAMRCIFLHHMKDENRLEGNENTVFEECIDNWLNKHMS